MARIIEGYKPTAEERHACQVAGLAMYLLTLTPHDSSTEQYAIAAVTVLPGSAYPVGEDTADNYAERIRVARKLIEEIQEHRDETVRALAVIALRALAGLRAESVTEEAA